MTWWVHELTAAGAYVQLISWIFWVPLSITLHELAHGWAAIREGDRTPIIMDRMTFNPWVHMGPQSLLLFALCGIAWGLMPVDPSRFRNGRRGEILVAAAGPLMNLLLALVTAILLVVLVRFATPGTRLAENLGWFLFTGLFLNLFLAPLNLLPVPPLDGSRIVAGLSRTMRMHFSHPNAHLFGLAAFFLIFFVTPAGSILWSVVFAAATIAVDLPGAVLGSPALWDILSP